jgi:GTP-binding protein
LNFFDHVKIYIKAGDGGNGAIAFHREKYVSHGGPVGGDGGNGGNIVFRVDKGTNTLLAYRYKHKFVAQNGGNGTGEKFHGATADDLVLTVPEGTLIKDAATGKVIHDMSDNGGADFIACRGGRGGYSREGGYSMADGIDDMMEKAEEMLEEAETPEQKQAIHKFIKELERMK